MNSTTRPLRDLASRYSLWIAVGLAALGAVPVGLTRGLPGVVLWVAFATLSASVLLFWEVVRLLADSTAPGDEAAAGSEDGVPAELEERKRAAMRALKDIEFEHAIHRLGDDDYEALKQQYRAEARAAMRAVDEGLGEWLGRAEALLSEVEHGGRPSETVPKKPTEPPGTTTKSTTRPCGGCGTRNDLDAVFCKKCGAKFEEADHA